MKNKETQAINARIPQDVYEDMQEIIKITKKATGSFVTDAIVHYIGCVKQINENEPDYLKIDRFGFNLIAKKGKNK